MYIVLAINAGVRHRDLYTQIGTTAVRHRATK